MHPAEAALEHDRTRVSECLTRVKKALHNYDWLITSRGSYEWNDDRWHEEFKRASETIWEAIQPMVKIAADWTYCPTKWEDVQAARVPAATQEQPAGSGANSLNEAAQEILKPHWPSVRNMEESEARQKEVERIVRILRGSPRKVGEDGPRHITIDYAAKALEAAGKSYSIRDAQTVARTLNALLHPRPSSVPVGAQKQEEGV